MRRVLEKVKYFGLRKLYYTTLRMFVSAEDLMIDLNLWAPEKRQSLTKHTIARTLIKLYSGDAGHNIEEEYGFLGFGLVHYAIARNTKPSRILCIGSRQGFIPAILALACKDNRAGHVDFVDAGYGPDEPAKHWSGIGFWGKVNPADHFAKIGVQNFITTHIMTTEKFAKSFPNKRYQYVYVDGDHSYEGVRQDYQLFWPRLDRGGFMAFHDVVARGYLDKGRFGVWRFWEKVPKKYAIVFAFPKHSGLGIIQKL